MTAEAMRSIEPEVVVVVVRGGDERADDDVRDREQPAAFHGRHRTRKRDAASRPARPRLGSRATASTPPTSRSACACSPRPRRCPSSIPTRSPCGARPAALFKTVKERRRAERRAAVLAADAAADRRDGDRRARAHRRRDRRACRCARAPTAPSAGTLVQARACYVCKQRYVELDAFYHQLCPACAARNRARRDARTDLRGRRALLTGGRAKIGMYIALRLLRDGAQTTITTRFPRDAARRFAAMDDSERVAAPAADRRHRPARSRPRRRARRRGRRRGAARHPHQQRLPDRAPLGRGLRAARAAPRRRRCRPARCRRSAIFGAGARRPRSSPATRRLARAALRGSALVADAGRPHRARAERRLGVARADRGRARDRRRRPRARPRPRQQLEPRRRRGRPGRAARGPALQPDRAVHPRRPAARGARGVERAAHVHRQRVGDRGPVPARLQGARATRTRTCPRRR